MLSEEEKKSIDKLKKIREDTIKANECGLSNNDFKEEIEILSKYLGLTDKEVEDLEDMKIDKILQEHVDKINNLISLVPKDLKAGQEVIKECPNCGAKLRIAKASINGHLWITCEKEGVLICQ